MSSVYRHFLKILATLILVAVGVLCFLGGFTLALRSRLVVLDSHQYGLICAITLLSVSGIFVLASLCACRESCKQDAACLFSLLSFFGVSASVIVALIATAGLIIILPLRIDEDLDVNLYRFLNQYGSGDAKKTEDIDKMQTTYKCCGVHLPTDWVKSSYGKYPWSCCRSTDLCKSMKHIFAEHVQSVGCRGLLQEVFYNNFLYLIIGAASLLFTLMLSFIVACVSMKLRRNVPST